MNDLPHISELPPESDPSTPGQRQATEWFVRLHSGHCTAAERRDFEDWLASDAAHRQEYAAVETLWHELDGLRPPAPRRRSPLHWAAAAMLLLAVGVGAYVFFDAGVYRTAKGETRSLTLADGTVVHLNTQSVIAVEFTATARTVTLHKGEALFEVAPDAQRPFAVIADDTIVRDIGTRFDVDRHGAELKIAVAEGRVAVGGPEDEGCLLDAGYATTLAETGRCSAAERFHAERALAWREGKVVFDATPLAQVVEQFNRYAEVPLRLTDPDAAHLELSGTFRIAHLGELPALLPRILPVAVERDATGWVLRTAAP